MTRPATASGRMPWLSAEHPFGDTSPLTRFVIGLDEALRDYRGSEDVAPAASLGPSRDPWNEDLFYRHLPAQPRVLGPEKESPTEGGRPRGHAARPASELAYR